ncbi:ribosomal-processing cysteine protease Prp [Exiguobacterium sp. A1_3_1]|uniref:ribosomal-processing cysteine protease Prp n=1 Tax=Exiguobacterium sp. A1_3_1 TaxID=2651871 RepID=UPI003B89586D
MYSRSEGHANDDVHGMDVVCVGVSAVTFRTVNSIEAMLEIVPEHTRYEDFLKIDIPERIDPTTFEQVQLMLGN